MAVLTHIGVALGGHRYTAGEIESGAAQWLASDPELLQLFLRYLHSSLAQHRHYSLTIEELLTLGGMASRAAIFEARATELAREAISRCLETSHLPPISIRGLITTSCSLPAIPALDTALIPSLKMNGTMLRVPIFQHGCAGGVAGLALASKLSMSCSPVFLVSVEQCTLGFQPRDLRRSQLVGAALFSDGAGCAVIETQGPGLQFVDSQSFLLPNTRHLMGYDIWDDGFHLRLDRDLPAALSDYIGGVVSEFLGRNKLVERDIEWWLFHPGGIKILDLLEATFALGRGQCKWARYVLEHFGNMSSASILFVLNEFLKEKHNSGHVLVIGIGPGLTIETILFRHQ